MVREGFTLREFGRIVFDRFVVAHWDPNSALSRNEQNRSLVDKWIRLGRYGRTPYFGYALRPEEIPPYIPQDLLSDEERQVDGQIERTILVRTWFGEKNNKASQEGADAAYEKLLLYVLRGGEPDDDNMCMDEAFIFDKKEEFFNGDKWDVSDSPDIKDGIALGTPGSIPSYVVTALMHCPDQIDGNSDEKWRHHSQSEAEADAEEWDLERLQKLLVLVADKKACEDGWVLYLALNHRGQVLRFRIRGQAREASTLAANWDDGQALVENTDNPHEDVEFYLHSGGGWD